MKISWSRGASVICAGKIFHDGWGRNCLDEEHEEALGLEGESMKQVKICYTKLLTVDVEDNITRKEISKLVDDIALNEIFQDGEYDDVEWEVWE